MKNMAILSLSLASAVLLGIAAPAVAAPPGHGSSHALPDVAGPLSPAERDDLTRQFVRKWGHYAQRVHGVPVDTWSERMVPSLMLADPDNFRAALQRDTFEGAMAEVSGTGKRLSDDEVISLLAASGDDGTIQTLGALTNDLVYTPLQPCRILDTRNTGAGAIAANSSRNFITYSADFAFQGGSATNCGTPAVATAVAINLTAVTPAGAGFATAFPFGTTQPVASSINYTAGAIVNNALVVQTPNPLTTSDITIYTFAQSHFVADIVGYFAPPVATAIQCVNTANTTQSVAAGGTTNVTAPSCAAGYTQTATNCEATSWDVPFVFFKNGTCSAKNNGASAANVSASRTCCRVPGR